MNVFKKVIILLIIGICISCESDDETNNTVQSILGDWEVISFIVDGQEVIEPDEPCFDKYFITEENA